MILHRVLPVENYSIVGKFIQLMKSSRTTCGKQDTVMTQTVLSAVRQFHSGGYHPADQKLYDHMREKDECHRQRAGRMNWKISSWSHDVPRKLWFQY